MDLYALIIMALLVLLLCSGMVLYFRDLQHRYYDVAAQAIGSVDEVRVRETPTFSRSADIAADSDSDPQPERRAASPLTIEGSKVLTVGRPSLPFRVAEGLPAGAAAGLRWQLVPADAGTLDLGSDSSAPRVIAARGGVLRVEATVETDGGRVTHRGSFESAVVEPRTQTLELPWVGQGIGSFVISTLILGVALYLGYVGVLEGAVVATILTAIAGYVFGTANAVAQTKN